MTPNTKPLFALEPEIVSCTVTTANLNIDGVTGDYATLLTAPVGHLKVSQLSIKAQGTTSAGLVRVFISDSLGANFKLKDEISIDVITPSATVKSASNAIILPDFELKSGQIIKVSTTITQKINVFAQIGTLGA